MIPRTGSATASSEWSRSHPSGRQPSGGPSKAAIVRRVMRDRLLPRQLEQFRWADVCVSAGGGYLYDDGSRTARLNIVRRLLPLHAARRAGVPAVLFSQSIGPFASDVWRSLVGRELRRSRLVIVREELSQAACREMGVPTQLCDDVAFALEPAALPAPAPEVSRATIGVTVMTSLPGVDAAGHRSYLDAVATGLVRALRDRSESVAVISQVTAHAGDDDVTAGVWLADRLGEAGVDACFVDLRDATDEELSAFYGRLTLVVASRMHSAVLALCAGTPVIALSYLPKTDGLFRRLGLSGWVLPAAGLRADALTTAIWDALARRGELASHLQQRLPGARESARRAIELTLGVPACTPQARPAPRLSAPTSRERREVAVRSPGAPG